MKIKFKFSIARKLSLGFGLLMIGVLANSILTYKTLDDNLQINNEITQVYTPSASYLNDLLFMISNSKMLIKNWVHIDKKNDTPDKIKLKEIHDIEYTGLREDLAKELVPRWETREQEEYFSLLESIDSLFAMHKNIMSLLADFKDYEKTMIIFEIHPQVEDNGEVIVLTDRILRKLDDMVQKQEARVEKYSSLMKRDFSAFQDLIIKMGAMLFIAILLIAAFTTRSIVIPINYIKNIIHSMSQGIFPSDKIKITGDEIGEMAHALEMLINGLKKIVEFSLEIGKGNFISEFRPLSEQDGLGNSLLIMRDNLKKASEDETTRKREDSQRSWTAQGLARFSEILRKSSDNLEEFSYEIISKLVKYMNANQGGIYILNKKDEKDIFLELKASYAFDRNKMVQDRTEIGVDLVGQCVKEAETMYLTDIPKNYITITSGLGGDTPRCLIIVPLKLNDEIYGAVELASFNNFEQYQIDFVEKIGESIASTIANVKINESTALLLSESQEKSERLAQQEEITRKKIEEMKAAQEEMQKLYDSEVSKNALVNQQTEQRIREIQQKFKKQIDNISRQKSVLENNHDAIRNAIGIVELNLEGEFIKANDIYLANAGLTISDIKGNKITEYMLKEQVNAPEFRALWPALKRGEINAGSHQYFFKGKEKWFYEVFTPVKDSTDNFFKVIILAFDISDLIEKERKCLKELEELKKATQIQKT